MFPYPIRRINTLGDGSCFLHAVLRSIWTPYKELDISEKYKTVTELRHELADIIDTKKDTDGLVYYQKLSRGKLEEISKCIDHTKLEEMKRFLRSNEYFTHLYLEFISEVFNIDIYIIDYKTMKLYNNGDDELLYKDRDSIILGYNEHEQHFESLEVEVRPGKFKTFFEYDSNIIKEIKTRKQNFKK